MSSLRATLAAMGLGCGGTISIGLGISAFIGAFCWPYAINTWLVFADKDPVVLWWHGALIGLVPAFGQLSLPVTIITWIAMLFLK
ncbi:MAG: hypothetical protein PHF86_13910 [Candidatus Nanoarchaeia archaeon]|jgi:hypothetical protein|nr:hypothetical protein [Candidatus Nanoarchaeia archaeon]